MVFNTASLAQGGPDSASGPVYRDIVYGDAAAPVTIIEYASLTCGYCGDFYNQVLPELKRAYIDTGKVKLVFRDYPLDGLAMAAAILARCAPGDRGKAMLGVMFSQQATWTRSERPIEPLTAYAKLAGMNEDNVNACLKNDSIISAIRTRQEIASSDYNIEATPTFFIEDVKVSGNRGFAFMAEIIESKLAE